MDQTEHATSDIERTASNLLENGLDALRSGAEMLLPEAPNGELRIALREVSSGIELILKGILAREHWSLIVDTTKKPASLAAFRKGDFRSVGFEECVQRLAQIVGVPIDPDRKKHLQRMRDKRNQLEHMGILDNVYALRASIAGALHAVAGLLKDAADLRLVDAKHRSLHTELAVEFSEITDFVEIRWKELQPHLARNGGKPCPACSQYAGKIDDGLICLFCGARTEGSEAADHYLETVHGWSSYETIKDGGEWPVHDCLDCGQTALVDTGDYECFSCGVTYKQNSLARCGNCENLFASEDPGGGDICTECLQYEMERE